VGRLTQAVRNISKIQKYLFIPAPFLGRITLIYSAQRLAAQPLGHVRFMAIILTGILKSHSGVLSLSLGQVGCSRGLGLFGFNSLNYLSHNNAITQCFTMK
jgi:hypothetical protein